MHQDIMQEHLSIKLPLCTKESPLPKNIQGLHPDMVFDHTYEDWIDGDEDDYYICPWCNTTIKEYISR